MANALKKLLANGNVNRFADVSFESRDVLNVCATRGSRKGGHAEGSCCGRESCGGRTGAAVAAAAAAVSPSASSALSWTSSATTSEMTTEAGLMESRGDTNNDVPRTAHGRSA